MNGPGARRVLVVDDEAALATLVGDYLARDGFDVTIAHDGPTALEQARAERPDVIVLDVGLPGIDGIEVCRQVRTFSDCYIIMLTARSDEVDKIVGLSVGADDYLTKPFSVRELVARVQAMLRRPRTGADAERSNDEVRVFGTLTIDPPGHEVRVDDGVVDLTPTEFDLLTHLSARPRVAFNRRALIEAVWGTSWVGDERLVDVHMGNLRRKLGDDPAAPRFIRTVRGVGYRMGEGG